MGTDYENAFNVIRVMLDQIQSYQINFKIQVEKQYESIIANIYNEQRSQQMWLLNRIENIQSAIVTTLSNYLGGITAALKTIDDRLRLIDNKVHDVQEKLQELKTLLETFNERLVTIMRTLDEFVKDFYTKMEQQLTDITNTIQTAYEIQNDFIQSQINLVNNNIDNTQKSLSQDIKTSSIQIIDNIKETSGQIMQNITQSTNAIIADNDKQTTSILSTFYDELGAVAKALDRFDENLVSCLWAIYNDLKQYIADIIWTTHGTQIVAYKDGKTLEEYIKSQVTRQPEGEVIV